ncbi:glucoamylase family protein, partial [Sphingopyxis bauzanensis]|uniref:glucoamylase family protein n=1 Tax=Sphingopyxis bauzanensis TaxID=651663 RepID=UPI001F258F55
MGSPTHAVGKDAWDKGWAADLEKDWGTYYGQQHLQFEPMSVSYTHLDVYKRQNMCRSVSSTTKRACVSVSTSSTCSTIATSAGSMRSPDCAT